MNLIIPFEKKVKFTGPVKEICSISLEHEITKNDTEILGNFIISGTYKEYELSINKSDFNFTLPFSVDMPDNIDKDSVNFSIDNFTYDLDDDELLVKIDYVVDADEIRKEEVIENNEDIQEKEPTESIIEKEKVKEEIVTPLEEDVRNSNDMVSMLDTEDDYALYHVHIVSGADTIESICEKYNMSKDDLLNINNITEINENDKLLIPLDNE